MKPLISLLVIIAVLVLMWGVAAVRMTAPVESGESVTITQEMYDQIRDGMTVDEVEGVVGKPTTVESATTPAGTHTDCRYWKDKKGNHLYIRFLDGKLSEVIDCSIK